MDSYDTLEQASEISDHTLKKMREVGAIPNPNNFRIWYHYFAADNPTLKKALDMRLEQDNITPATK